MPKPPLPDTLVALLRKPNPAVIASIRPDGTPETVATWYEWGDDGRVLVNMDAGRVRLGHMRTEPAVAMTVMDRESWYRHVSLRGRITDLRKDEGMRDIDRLSLAYLGVPYQRRGQDRVSAWLTVSNWYAWDATTFKEDGQAAAIER